LASAKSTRRYRSSGTAMTMAQQILRVVFSRKVPGQKAATEVLRATTRTPIFFGLVV
jgi:hypothetical protein